MGRLPEPLTGVFLPLTTAPPRRLEGGPTSTARKLDRNRGCHGDVRASPRARSRRRADPVGRPGRRGREPHRDASGCRSHLRVCWERVTRIELALSAWEAEVLPLNYTRAAP